LFEPLGITRLIWTRDRAGQAHGLAGLHLLPRDLAKLGELVLAGGDWNGRRVLDAAWIRRITREPAPIQPAHKRLALLWWLLPSFTERTIDASVVAEWRRAQVDSALVEQLRTLEGKRYRSGLALVRALRTATGDPELALVDREIWKKKLPDARYTFGPSVGSFAQGSLGQFLVVLPEAGLVAVRMRRSPRDPAERDDIEKGFPDFPDRVIALVRPD
jgi:CubicO group peptidase (beta-lactamase class C family)